MCTLGTMYCDGKCIDPSLDLEHCGGCSSLNGMELEQEEGGGVMMGVDCTTLSDGDVSCVLGVCVVDTERDLF